MAWVVSLIQCSTHGWLNMAINMMWQLKSSPNVWVRCWRSRTTLTIEQNSVLQSTSCQMYIYRSLTKCTLPIQTLCSGQLILAWLRSCCTSSELREMAAGFYTHQYSLRCCPGLQYYILQRASLTWRPREDSTIVPCRVSWWKLWSEEDQHNIQPRPRWSDNWMDQQDRPDT